MHRFQIPLLFYLTFVVLLCVPLVSACAWLLRRCDFGLARGCAAAENATQAPATTEQLGPVALRKTRHGRVGGRFWDTTPIVVPITSPETTSSTRRFCWRPSAESLVATGCVLPNPCAVMDAAGIFSFAR